ncbi:hypothetical protein IWQ60_005848 [Tieghemiomyces parasiticus]|uniref:Transcription factor domain-containing protein n=1 Tax=Tieghemiomyces parasiticus TaxID=78921 RepID=A0A9W8DY48_9FUNG|nr:hypothetical protein IWQ60_005848 [Tieghemiomyces parasiticus]
MAPCSASTPRSAVSVADIPISDILPSHDFFLDLPSNPTMLPDDVVQFLDSLGPAELDMLASLDSPGTHTATSNNGSEEVLSNSTGGTGSPVTLPGASSDILQKPSTTAGKPQPSGLAAFSHSATSPSHPTEGMSTEVTSNANSIYPSLFTPTDLLFHSEVFKTAMYSFCRRTYKSYAKPLYRRLIYRLEHGLISEELQLCIASNTRSMIGSAAFQSIPPFMIKAVYNERLRAMVPSILERNSIDSITVMNLLATAFMGAGYYSTSFSIQAAVTRKLLMWRVHLIDQQPPPPPLSEVLPSHANDPVIDATQITNELLIDHLRMLWWMTVVYDMCISLVFGLQPSFDLDSCAVDWPSNPTELRDSLTSALGEVGSAFYTDGTFPTLVLSSGIKLPRGKARIPVMAISHDIVVARHYRATDPVRWLDEWRRLNNELARWRSEVTISFVSTACESDSEQTHPKRRNPHRSPHSELAHAMKKFHTHKLTLYLLLLIYHNHLDGPLGVQVQSGPPVSDLHGDPDEGRDDNDYGIDTRMDQDDIEVPEVDGIPRQVVQAVMIECHTRSWTAVQELHDIIDSFKDLTRFPHYHLLLGSLYSSAVICIQIIHGRGLLTADVYRASHILHRCKERLVELAPHYIGNLKILQAISTLEARPRRHYSLTLAHLL